MGRWEDCTVVVVYVGLSGGMVVRSLGLGTVECGMRVDFVSGAGACVVDLSCPVAVSCCLWRLFLCNMLLSCLVTVSRRLIIAIVIVLLFPATY